MVIWGAVWGAILGLMWPGHDNEFQFYFGMALGALAGLSLRFAVRAQIRAMSGNGAAKTPSASQFKPKPGRTAAEMDDYTSDAPPVNTAPQTPPAVQAEAVASPDAASMPAPPSTSIRTPDTPATSGPNVVTTLVSKARDWLFGGNTVVRLGVLVLFIGLAFLAKYAVDNALVPPELRLAGIGLAGAALLSGGLYLRRKGEARLGYALTLQGAGIGVLYLTVFASFRLYQFLPAGMAFGMLGLICACAAVIALAQNSQALAVIAFAGGFAAPVLVSTGQGSHMALFSYYAVLGLAIAVMAWAKPWRGLNLLGFFATFGIATAWGVLKYRPELLSSTFPFLVIFFAIYLCASLFHALRHAHPARRAVDATLVFGTPIAAFSLLAALVHDIEFALAFSALALGGLYLGLAWRMLSAASAQSDPVLTQVRRWLAECFAALGLGFVTLAVPLALDGHWTSAVWAIEGAGVYWMGRRQGRWLAQCTGLALQGLAAMLYLDGLPNHVVSQWPFANASYLGSMMLSASALAIARWSSQAAGESASSPLAERLVRALDRLSPAWFWLGFAWLQWAMSTEIHRSLVDASGLIQPALSLSVRTPLQMLAWTGAAFAFHHLALSGRPRPWSVAGTPVRTVMPVMLLTALYGMATQNHVFEGAGWWAWPLAIALHLVMLRRMDAGAPQRWWAWVHAGGVWLLVLLLGNGLAWTVDQAQLWQTAWASVILLVAGTSVLLMLASKRCFNALQVAAPWPLTSYAPAYLWRAAAPIALALCVSALAVAAGSPGHAAPLPYVPLLNPTDLAVGLALASCTLWLSRLRASSLQLRAWVRGIVPVSLLGGLAFVAINTVWLRVAHHYANVPWQSQQLFDSFVVQAGYSVLWTMLALVLMVMANRRAMRAPWMLGAALLGLTVLKLFIIDMSNRGGSERIFVFIAVGLLMLIVGYFAPLPPARIDPDGRSAGKEEHP